MLKQWERVDEEGNTQIETYVPEFDVSVKIDAEKPSDRDYYTRTAFELFQAQALSVKDLWYTIEEGKLPPRTQAISNLELQNQGMQIATNLSKLDPSKREQIMQLISQLQMETKLDSLPDEQLMMLQQLAPQDQEKALNMLMEETNQLK